VDNSVKSGRRSVLVAGAGTVLLLVLSGVGYRVVADYLARPGNSLPLPPGTLARLPLRLGGWHGRDEALDEAVVEATDTDDQLSRVYARGQGAESVSLFVAYGVRARDLAPHRPEVCYPGSGWTLEGGSPADLPLSDGSTLPCRILRFSRAGLTARQVTVLNYYIVDGRYCPDISAIRARAWRGQAGVRYLAQVQIISPGGGGSADAAGAAVSAFATDSALAIRALLPDVGPPASGG
jgi:EpsI family protein